MKGSISRICLIVLAWFAGASDARAETIVIPFSDLRLLLEDPGSSPEDAIEAYLAGLLGDQLLDLGFSAGSDGLIGDFPIDEITEIIDTNCPLPSPFEVHTDASTAVVEIDESSSIVFDLDSIRDISIELRLTGTISTVTNAWVRWGINIPFGNNCQKYDTDHGWVSLDQAFELDLDIQLELDPAFDDELVAIVVDKRATVDGEIRLVGGTLDYDFGTISLTELLLAIFEDELLDELQAAGVEAVGDEIVALNLRLDGLDADGNPDPAIEPFNGPTTFVIDVGEDDEDFIQALLAELGIPDIVLSMVVDRGIEILLNLAILEGAEREAYLLELGVQVGCEALFGRYRIALGAVPIYQSKGELCFAARDGFVAPYYTDPACTDELAFEPGDEAAYCQSRFGDQARYLLGNAAAWIPDADQPNDPLPQFASRPWTTVPATELDLGVVSMDGNYRPYMKQVGYKTITGIPRGNGTCQLEMRIYKKDIAAQGLKPLLALHGGTWKHRGFSFSGLEAGISHFTERGFIVFAPFYRLAGQSDGNVECNDAGWREITEDVESALDWVQANGPALGASSDQVTVFGQSAGAHLAAWLAAYRETQVRKALLYYGPTDILEFMREAIPPGSRFEAYRDFALSSLATLFGARSAEQEVRLDAIDFVGLDPATLEFLWKTVIHDGVFDLTAVDPLDPPSYLRRCAEESAIDLTSIDLAAPPVRLMNCIKLDLRDFLLMNSLSGSLGDEAVPIFALHGSGDSLVPYEQAIALCAAIEQRPLPTDIVDAWTVYRCGLDSEVHVVRDAEHALDLGACVDTLCPAGPTGSESRAAAAAAINAGYEWIADGGGPTGSHSPPPKKINGIGAVRWLDLLVLAGILMLSFARQARRRR